VNTFQSTASLVLLSAICSCGHGTTAPENGGALNSDLRSTFSHGTCTGTGPVRFTNSPLAVADIGDYAPLGTVIHEHVTPIDHQYLYPLDLSAGRTRYTVYAPFQGHIVMIQTRPASAGSVDYRIVIEGTCTYWVIYDLVTELEPGIATAVGNALASGTATVRIAVAPNQIIGKVGGQSLDLGVYNSELTLPGLLVAADYAYEPWKVHTDDPLNYFDEPLKSQLLARNRRTIAPRGGKIDYDIDGTARGSWFLVGTHGYQGLSPFSYWTGHLSLTYDSYNPSLLIFSTGSYNGTAAQFAIRGNGPDFAAITPTSGVTVYELVNWSPGAASPPDGPVLGVAVVQMVANRQLRMQLFPGQAKSQVSGFTAAALNFER
jgi:hypothetical protein